MTHEEQAKIARAQSSLRMFDVIQRFGQTTLASDFLPPFVNTQGLRVETTFGPTGHRVHEGQIGTDSGDVYGLKIVEFVVVAVAKFFPPTVAEGNDSTEQALPEVTLAEIKAEFAAAYIWSGCDNEDLIAYGQWAVGMHVWPFWREFLQTQCVRMRLPPITIGFLRDGRNADAAGLSEELLKEFGTKLLVHTDPVIEATSNEKPPSPRRRRPAKKLKQ